MEIEIDGYKVSGTPDEVVVFIKCLGLDKVKIAPTHKKKDVYKYRFDSGKESLILPKKKRRKSHTSVRWVDDELERVKYAYRHGQSIAQIKKMLRENNYRRTTLSIRSKLKEAGFVQLNKVK